MFKGKKYWIIESCNLGVPTGLVAMGYQALLTGSLYNAIPGM